MNKEKCLSYLGEPLTLSKVGIYQKDPFIANMFGYIHHCLNEIAKLLNKVVVFTFKAESQSRQKAFFLIGFEHRRGFSKKIFGNPELEIQGSDLKWLVKNVRWHLKKYADNLNVYEDVLDDLTGFLFDTVVKCYLGSVYLNDISSDADILNDCIEVGQEIASAIEESQYYESLKSDAVETKQNLEALQKILTEYQQFQVNINEASNKSLDSKKALDFVQNVFVPQLKKEKGSSRSNDVSKKPATNHVFTSLIPRLNCENEDSGIVADIENLSSSSLSTPYSAKRGSTSTPMHSKSVKSTPGKSKMESSMVIIDTPVIRNKALDQVKKTPKSTPKRKGSPNGEIMDGSFVLI